MFELMTAARPYAKAVFDFAIEQKRIKPWQDMLTFSDSVARNEQMASLISVIKVPHVLSSLFIAVCGDQLDKYGQNLIKVMAENGRLATLPAVLKHFIQLRNAYEAIMEVEVISASVLNVSQLSKINSAMEKRLSRKVKINYKVDKSVMAGMIIHAGDIVIDGSVRSRLERLADVLQS
ncbi:F0F1 ATP synthase subunit delta [Pantoea sp. Nvir]|uniref:F0F1 ATP synthase subunit delta n=1 Tax=Pantoea sp. Nvir TaxID=2576760 RepID=UPI0027FE2C42|nr:F0F1 ATP synthase subunit delta [Pantoea sp. Nvir]CAJ0990728.1 ATP synthase subunit delta [Pantoea sp. Nvir]